MAAPGVRHPIYVQKQVAQTAVNCNRLMWDMRGCTDERTAHCPRGPLEAQLCDSYMIACMPLLPNGLPRFESPAGAGGAQSGMHVFTSFAGISTGEPFKVIGIIQAPGEGERSGGRAPLTTQLVSVQIGGTTSCLKPSRIDLPPATFVGVGLPDVITDQLGRKSWNSDLAKEDAAGMPPGFYGPSVYPVTESVISDRFTTLDAWFAEAVRNATGQRDEHHALLDFEGNDAAQGEVTDEVRRKAQDLRALFGVHASDEDGTVDVPVVRYLGYIAAMRGLTSEDTGIDWFHTSAAVEAMRATGGPVLGLDCTTNVLAEFGTHTSSGSMDYRACSRRSDGGGRVAARRAHVGAAGAVSDELRRQGNPFTIETGLSTVIGIIAEETARVENTIIGRTIQRSPVGSTQMDLLLMPGGRRG